MNPLRKKIFKMGRFSIRRNLWTAFLLHALFVVVLFGLFQVVFLRASYMRKVDGSLRRAASAAHSVYQKPDTAPEAAGRDEQLRVALDNGNNCAQVRVAGIHALSGSKVLMDTEVRQCTAPGCPLHSSQPVSPFAQIKGLNRVLENVYQNQQSFLYTFTDDRHTLLMDHQQYRVLISNFTPADTPEQTVFVLVTQPLDGLDDTLMLLTDQLFAISSVVLLVATAVALWLSRMITRPIVRTTNIARRMAEGDFTVSFPRSRTVEMDEMSQVLGYAATRLSEVDRLRRELIANVSHDLRTPLTMIQAYAEMLQDFSGEDKKQREQHIEVILSEANRLTKLVADLLTLSQLQTNSLDFAREPFDIVTAIGRACQALQPLADSRKIHLSIKGPANQTIYGDEARLGQVLYNLISNALQYTQARGEVTIAVAKRKSGWVRVSVIDTGCGIPADVLPHVWERYTRAREHKSRSGGTGLGLAIVHEILTASGARFGVTSRMGIGSTFWFELRSFL